MTLEQARKAYPWPKLSHELLGGQEAAFVACMEFLVDLEKTKTQNPRRCSYGLKHIVENPSRLSGVARTDCYNDYVYEGTLILAALASGFTLKRLGGVGPSASLNYSERSLRKRAQEWANKSCQAQCPAAGPGPT